MKQYAFVDWELVHSTPLRHTYRCPWREFLLGAPAYRAAQRPKRRHVTIEWNGTNVMSVRTGRLLGSRARWTNEQVRQLVFGLREMSDRELPKAAAVGWLWFVQLTAQSAQLDGSRLLAEFLVAHQVESPASSHARVPARVQELLDWLSHCTGHRAHGPILVTDEDSRRRILSHVD